ncbi:hypothetical protein CR513_37440, partial [Mucuna pruriens]
MDLKVVFEIKKVLSSKFEMRDLVEAYVIMEYEKIIGSVVYIINYTRPNTAYALSRFPTMTIGILFCTFENISRIL